jgi:hypothetical protein
MIYSQDSDEDETVKIRKTKGKKCMHIVICTLLPCRAPYIVLATAKLRIKCFVISTDWRDKGGSTQGSGRSRENEPLSKAL